MYEEKGCYTFPTHKSQYYQLQHHELGESGNPQIKPTFLKKFIVKEFFIQAKSQKVCGGAEFWRGESEKASVLYISYNQVCF